MEEGKLYLAIPKVHRTLGTFVIKCLEIDKEENKAKFLIIITCVDFIYPGEILIWYIDKSMFNYQEI